MFSISKIAAMIADRILRNEFILNYALQENNFRDRDERSKSMMN